MKSNKISAKAKLIGLIFLLGSIIISKSIYLILFLTTLIIILYICTKRKVKEYVKFIKNILFILAFILVFYIIIMGEYNIFNILIIIYKELMISIVIKLFSVNMNFFELDKAVYGLLSILRIKNLEVISYNICMSLYLIKYFINSKQSIKEKQLFNGVRTIRLRYYLYPRVLNTLDELDKLQISLKCSHYKLILDGSNLKSKIVVVIAILFFALCIFKEVIL